MKLEILPDELTVCKLYSVESIDPAEDFYFIGKTADEISLVCRTKRTPVKTAAREDGWRGFRIDGTLDFSLVGILSRILAVLAENGIGIFAVSTFNTDYILVKAENLDQAASALKEAGYDISR